MTTLPQTTPLRLPRQGGNSQLAAPSGGAPATLNYTAAPSFAMTGGDVWRVIRANLWLIILFAMVFGAAGYFANDYVARYHSVYTANSVVRLIPPESVDPSHQSSGWDTASLMIMQSTEVQLLKSEHVLDDVLKESDNPVRTTNWWKVTCGGDPQKAHEQFVKNVSVSPMPDSPLIKVSVSCSDAHDSAILLTALVERAIQDEKIRVRENTESDLRRLSEKRAGLQIELHNASIDVQNKAEDLAKMGQNTNGTMNVKDMELSRLVEAQVGLQSQKLAEDNAFTAFKAQKEQGEVPSRVADMVEQDRDVVEYKNTVESLELRLAQDTNSGPQSPEVKQLNSSLQAYRSKLADARAEKTAHFMSQMEADMVSARDTAAQNLQVIDTRIDHLKSDISQLSVLSNAYLVRREEEARYREQVNEVDKQIADMDQMIRQAEFGTIDWFDGKPLQPTVPSWPNLTTFMAVSIAVGLFLSLGIAFLREITDTTVRSPRDIARVGQMTLLGMVPHEADDPQSSGARLPLVIFEAPHSMMAEQLRQVRTRLQHAASLDTTRSILVTSPGPGDGKSTIAVNLAAGLALNGRRILLVDANFRRPELHRIFGVGNESGFSDVLNDVNAFSTAIRETSVPNLSVMASGPKPSNPTELLESQLLLDFIERALEEYDHVIFDSGPMLFVSESVALAPRVDGVVTVVKARTSSRGVLQRMRDGLRAVKAEHLGVVLNGVRSQAGGYYSRSIKTYYQYQNNT